MSKKLLCKSKNNKNIFLDEDNTNVHFHILETPNLLELVKETLVETEIEDEEQVVFEKDLGRIIGSTSLVETDENDEIVYAKRKNRNEYSRFVKNRELIPTSYIVIVLRKIDDGYNLWTAMCGRLLPSVAYDPKDKKDSNGFNRTHALVYDEKLIQLDTLTNVCPWDKLIY